VELTKNMLDVKDKSGMSDYPYFSKILYPSSLLNTYTYDQRWISFNEKTFKRLIYDNKTASCSNVGCKVDDFSISEKDEDVKDYSGEDGGDGEAMVMARGRGR
jgi:hypothetical protein